MSDRALDAVVFGIAAHRATRLVTKDTITRKVRDRLIRRSYVLNGIYGPRDPAPVGGWSLLAEQDDESPPLATLLTCRWCASTWCMAGLLMFAVIAPAPARWLRYILAGSSVAVLLSRIESE